MMGLRAAYGVLLETGIFADARVICFNDGLNNNDNERVEIPVHKRILAARSKMFSNGTDGDQMEIHDFPLDVVRAMLSYIYSGVRPELEGKAIAMFYKASHRFGVDTIRSERIRTEFAFDNFPAAFVAHPYIFDYRNYELQPVFIGNKRTLAGRSFRALSQTWSTELELQSYHRRRGDKTTQIDFVLKKPLDPNSRSRFSSGFQLPIFADLSLSILDSAYQKLHEVSLGLLRCTPSSVDNESSCTAVWKDCLDYEEILRKRQLDLLPATQQRFRYRLILRFEATIVIERGRYHHPNENEENSFREADLVQHFMSLLETGVGSDARLVCFEPSSSGNDEEKQKRIEIPVHKKVLAARSKFFAAAFSSDFVEAKTGCLEIGDFRPNTVWAMLRFVYTGTVPDSEEMDMFELYQLGHLYDVDGLALKCSMEFKPNVQNCCLLLNLAELYEDGALKERALHFFTTNKAAVKDTEGYAQLKSNGKCEGIAEKKRREVLTEATDWFRQLITDQKDDENEKEIEELRWLIEDQLRVCNEEEENNDSDDEKSEEEEEEATDRLFG